jgi:hypothetical protein
MTDINKQETDIINLSTVRRIYNVETGRELGVADADLDK